MRTIILLFKASMPQLPRPSFCAVICSLLLLTVSFSASGQSDGVINDWISEADEMFDKGDFAEAAAKYREILDKRPNFDYVKNKLKMAEEEILHERIQSQIDVENDASKYLATYGEKGKYYNAVRDELRDVYISKSYTYFNALEVRKLESLYLDYLKLLGASRDDLIRGRLVVVAQDSAQFSVAKGSWDDVVFYSELVLKYADKDLDLNIARENLALAEKKDKSGQYFGLGVLLNSQMPFGLFAAKLRSGALGWHASFQFSGNASQHFTSGDEVRIEQLEPNVPNEQVLFLRDSEQSFMRLSAGVNYNVAGNWYPYLGFGVLFVQDWQTAERYQRGEGLGSASLEGSDVIKDPYGEMELMPALEVGVEYLIRERFSVRYGYIVSGGLDPLGHHQLGLSYRFFN